MKKRLKGFFQRLARWLNVREMRHLQVMSSLNTIINPCKIVLAFSA